MIKSMTGFASVTHEDERASVGVTVRSVNHRYLDVQLRIPQSLNGMEPRLRALVQQRVARGRVEVSVSIQMRQQPRLEVELNETFVAALSQAMEKARAAGLVQGTLRPGDLLRFPQALTVREQTPELDTENVSALEAAIEKAMEQTLEDLDGMRRREGGMLRTDLDSRKQAVSAMMERISELAHAGEHDLKQRLALRVAELTADLSIDRGAVVPEVIRFVSRSDISEELVRFRAHVAQWGTLTDGPEPCGRKLDFLLQEMNREVNTTGSKADGPGVPEIVISMKAELEKMREQVQNVE